MGVGQTRVQAAAGRPDHAGDQGILLGDIDAVEGGLRGAHQAGDAGRNADLAGLMAAAQQAGDEGGGPLRNVGAEDARSKDAVVPHLGHLHGTQGRKAVVQAEDDQRRVETAHQHGLQPADVLAEEGEDCGKDRADVVAQRSKDGQSQGAHDDEFHHRDDDQPDGLGADLIEELFHRGLHQQDQHDRNDRIGIPH